MAAGGRRPGRGTAGRPGGRLGRRAGALALAAGVALLGAGCSGAGTDAAGSPAAAPSSAPAPTGTPDGAVEVLPGRPGEPNRTGTGSLAPAPQHNAADAEFVTTMVPHHAQALEMAALAPDRAQDPSVASLAARIAASQGPEVHQMAAWLQAADLPVPAEAERAGVQVPGEDGGHGGHGGHEGHGDHAGHEGMPGMATPEQMEQLEAASGAAFDRMFLELMIAHHEGALTMAEQLRATGGADVQVEEMSDHVIATQTAEIERMRGLLAG
ncbi:DUF305 domain-containing protein [Vallicoccus soli]|uniref:DUF305 domain-containing protein n=1 Tax=Vallicoccus soli TaxID=2339232 RepID=A0A3A3Z447_9ACTN|nr:DUF305 domain-containing protein [Vallicoccus soli]RJK97733.1 DUF305 domain-containing protein [Vallicoccus soli]